MPEITALKERRGRARVFVDGEFWAEIDASVALERGLYKGATISEDELGEARLAGEMALAMNRALRFLGYRARSEREVRDRLKRYGYESRTVEGVLERLRELGYLDDAEFARTAAREKARRYGPRRVALDLRRAGVDEQSTKEAVEEVFEGYPERESAYSAAARRYNTEEGSDAQARRVHGFLMRRGYSVEICTEVAREFRGSEPSGAGM